MSSISQFIFVCYYYNNFYSRFLKKQKN